MLRAIKTAAASLGMLTMLMAGTANASENKTTGNKECVNNVGGMSFDAEFGAGAGDITRCIEKRHKVKVVYQINEFCRDDVALADCKRPYALGNIMNAVKDYEINYGMKAGKDFDIVAVVTSGGGHQMIQDQSARKGNQFEPLVRKLMDKGVTFYYCQNTVRGLTKKGFMTPGHQTSEIIPGVKLVTSGVAAMPDLVSKGYILLQP